MSRNTEVVHHRRPLENFEFYFDFLCEKTNATATRRVDPWDRHLLTINISIHKYWTLGQQSTMNDEKVRGVRANIAVLFIDITFKESNNS